MPAISVIIPVYNVRTYLNRCLDSVLFQRLNDIEIICVDDGSTDGCDEILKSYAQKDKRIRVISTINQGLSAARNIGLSKATGNSIFFLDGDDALHPDCLAILWTILNETQADMVHCQFENSDGVSRRYHDINTQHIKYKLTHSYCFIGKRSMGFNVWSNLYKRSLLEGIKFIEGIYFEDVPFLLTVLARHPKIVVLNEKLYFYTMNVNSISHKPPHPKQILDYYVGLKHIYNVYCQHNLTKDLQYLKRTFIPVILKQQLGRCQRAEKKIQANMYHIFAQELHYLKVLGLLGWRGHKPGRYLTYLKLIKEYL